MFIEPSALSRKLSAFVSLSDIDLETLAKLHRRRRTFRPKHSLLNEGDTGDSCYVLAKGWACSFKLLPDGGRQIVNFHIPGDFLGLRSVLFRTTDHSVEAVTRIEASEMLPAEVVGSFEQAPRLATSILWSASRDEAMVVEHLVNLGRRTAEERVAHFLLELHARLTLVGLAQEDGFDCPLTQYHLADALGLSAVHVNRVLRVLREETLITFRRGRVLFDDMKSLRSMAGFNVRYLDHEGPLWK
jgi:CRP-like cAMP-binding protein